MCILLSGRETRLTDLYLVSDADFETGCQKLPVGSLGFSPLFNQFACTFTMLTIPSHIITMALHSQMLDLCRVQKCLNCPFTCNFTSSSVFQSLWSCCLNLQPAHPDKACCLLQVLVAAPQFLHHSCLPVTMSGTRECCGLGRECCWVGRECCWVGRECCGLGRECLLWAGQSVLWAGQRVLLGWAESVVGSAECVVGWAESVVGWAECYGLGSVGEGVQASGVHSHRDVHSC